MLISTAGSDRFYMNIEDMIGYKPVFFIKWCWMILTPGICAVSLIEQTKSIFNVTKHLTTVGQHLYIMTNSMNSIWGSNAVLHVLQGIFLFFLIKYKPLKYNNVYTYPDWGYGIGWFMAMSSMVCIPLGIIWMIWKTPGTFSEVKTRAANSQ